MNEDLGAIVDKPAGSSQTHSWRSFTQPLGQCFSEKGGHVLSTRHANSLRKMIDF